jgi:nitrogen regulatory protein PII
MQKYIATIDVEIHVSDDETAEEVATEIQHAISHRHFGEAYLLDIQTERFVNGKSDYVSIFE